jgi:(2Fe-2S) ferredoxin
VALADALKAMVKERGLGGRVIVSRTSCLKHCSRGITVAVYPDNAWYAKVTEGDLEEICASHLEGGQPVERLAMPDIPWE